MANLLLRSSALLLRLTLPLLMLSGASLVHAQTMTPSAAVYCPQLSQTLTRGLDDTATVPPGQVSEFQKFLASYYQVPESQLVVGYFGNLTQHYAEQFQNEQGLPSYGIVGVRTQDAMARACGGSVTTTSTAAYISAPSAGSSSTGSTGVHGGVSASIDAGSLTTTSATPSVSGSAYATSSVVVELADNSGSSVYARGLVPVVNNRWSSALVYLPGYSGATLSTGTYQLRVWDGATLLASGQLIVSPAIVGRSALPSCSINAAPNAVQPGGHSTIIWNTQNASSSAWSGASSSHGILPNTTVVPSGVPGLSGSQDVTFSTSGFSLMTLLVSGSGGSGTCSGNVLVLGSVVPAGFGGAFSSTTQTTASAGALPTTPIVPVVPQTPDPTGIISVSPCTVDYMTCNVSVNWIAYDSVVSGGPQVRIDVVDMQRGTMLAFDSQGAVTASGATNYNLVASLHGSKTFTLPVGTYAFNLYGYKQNGTTLLLQRQVLSVVAPPNQDAGGGA